VLVVAAMPIELKPFNRLLSLTRGTLGTATVFRGSIPDGDGVDVLAAVVGIGPAEATKATEYLLRTEPVDRVVMIGVAGALDPTLQVGDLVVPELVVDRATSKGHRPEPVQPVEPHGKMLTSAKMQSDPADLSRHAADGVIALDMETAAVAAVSERHGVPWSVFRGISDRVQDGIVDESTLALTKPDGSPNLKEVVKMVATRPSMVPKLIKLGRDSQKAVRASVEAGARECRAFAAVAAR
jgi:adenosylhomocysteine nucleosidase